MPINSFKLASDLEETNLLPDEQPHTYHIAIIGGGPKGLYGLERLLANLKAEPAGSPVAVHLFNRSPYFGAGDVYRPDQPDFLIMNYSNGNINIWPDGEPEPVVPEPLSFTAWLENRKGKPADPNGFASRAQVGNYLSEGFKKMAANSPEGVTLYTHHGEVTDLIPEGETYRLELERENEKLVMDHRFHQILLTTGHPRPHSGFPEMPGKGKIDRKEWEGHFIDTIYPVQQQLSTVRSRENVLVKGLGLTFIDAVLALTEGRGGSFSGTVETGMTYHPSGLEPHKIYPYSRTGLPMFPRTGNSGAGPEELLYFREDLLEQQFGDRNDIDFREELLPLIRREFIVSYYQVLFRNNGLQLNTGHSYAAVEKQIAIFHRDHPEEPSFSLEDLLSPLSQPALGAHEAFIQYLEQLLDAAKAGQEYSPLAAAVATWRRISPVFNRFYSFGRLDPDGHREFLQNYAGHFNRLAYGPPVENMEKIRALAAAGCLDFSFVRAPGIEYHPELEAFLITHAHHPLHTTAFYWIDARVPGIDIEQDVSALYQNLLKRDLIRPFENTNGRVSFRPGCLDLDFDGHPRDARGRPVKNITAYGTPTEGITYDNDTLSRSRNDFVSKWALKVVQEIKVKQLRS